MHNVTLASVERLQETLLTVNMASSTLVFVVTPKKLYVAIITFDDRIHIFIRQSEFVQSMLLANTEMSCANSLRRSRTALLDMGDI